MADKPLMQLTPEEVEKAYDEGLISAGDVDDYTLRHRFAEKGLFGLDPDEVEHAWDKGYIQDQDVDKYIDFKENPVMFRVKDAFKGAYLGPRNAISEGMNALMDLGDLLPDVSKGAPLDETFSEYYLLDIGQGVDISVPRGEERIDLQYPETGVGQFVEGGTRFLTGFLPGMKATKYLAKIPQLAQVAKTSPELFAFIRATLAGAGADAIVFDPHESRLSDLIEAYPKLSNPLTRWLKADPNDSAVEGRLKNVLEGAFAGAALESVWLSLKILKGRVWRKHNNIIDRVEADIDKATRKLEKEKEVAPSMDKGEIVDPGANLKAKSEGLDPVLEDLGVKRFGIDEQQIKPLSKESLQLADEIIDVAKGASRKWGAAGRPNFNYIETTFEAFRVMHTIAEKMPAPATRGFKTVEALARHIGGDATQMQDTIADLFGTVQRLDSKVKAVSDYLVTYNEFVTDIAKKAETTADYLQVAEHLNHYSDLMRMVNGANTEIARGLNANKIMSKARRFEFEKIDKKLLEEAIQKSDLKKLKKATKEFASLDTITKRANYARNFGRSRALNMMLEFRQSALVSALQTHAVNIIGTSGALTVDTMVKTFATLGRVPIEPWRIKQLGHLYTGLFKGFYDALYIPGGTKLLKGDVKGFKEAWDFKKAGKVIQAFIEGEPITDGFVKYDTPHGTAGAIPGEFRNVFKEGVPWWARVPVGDIIRLPFRALSTEDEFFKSVGYAQQKNFMAYEKAMNMTLEGGKRFSKKRFQNFFDTLMTEDVELHAEALRHSRDITFTTPMSGFSRKIGDALNHPVGLPFKMLFVPFYNVAMNIAKFTMQRSGFGLLGKRFWEDMAAGGIKRSEAIARVSLGSTFIGLGAWMYQNGMITGSAPKDQRDAWQAAGVQEYAFFTKDERSIQYNRIDPGSMWLGLGADLMRLVEEYRVPEKDYEKLFTMSVLVMADNLTSKTFMKGLQEAIDAMSGRISYEKYAKRTVSTLTPFSIASQYGQVENDEYLREIYSFRDALIKGTPHWLIDASEHLKPRRHIIYGTPVPRIDRVIGLLNVTEFDSQTDRGVLDMYMAGANMREMDEKLTVAGEELELDGDQYDRLVSMLEKLPVREALNQTYDAIKDIKDDETRAGIYMGVVNVFREAARALYLADDPKVIEEIIKKANARADAIVGLTTARDESTRTYHAERIFLNKE